MLRLALRAGWGYKTHPLCTGPVASREYKTLGNRMWTLQPNESDNTLKKAVEHLGELKGRLLDRIFIEYKRQVGGSVVLINWRHAV